MTTTTNVDAEVLLKQCETALLKIERQRYREWSELVDSWARDKRRKLFGIFTVGTNYTREEAEQYLKENEDVFGSPHSYIFNKWCKGEDIIKKVKYLCERALAEQNGDDVVVLDKEDWDVISHWKDKE